MGRVTGYASVTTLNEGGFVYIAIDTDSNGEHESWKMSLATLRSYLYDTNSNIVKESKGADIVSTNVLVIGTDGNYFDVTGTTAITSIRTVKVGTEVVLQFDGVLTLTHHATNLILPGGEDIVTSAGDHAVLREYDTGKWRLVSFLHADAGVMIDEYGALYFSTPAATTLAADTPTLAAGVTALQGPVAVDFVISAAGRLTYIGNQTKVFRVGFSGSATKASGGETLGSFYLYKGGSLITGARVNRTLKNTSDEGAFPVEGLVELSNGEYVELWISNVAGDDMTIQSGILMATIA